MEVVTLIATSGIRKYLPVEFPMDLAENSGNIVHGRAPSLLFPNTMSSLENNWRIMSGETSFRVFASKHCSHVIITMANLFRIGDHSENQRKRYKHFARSLRGYDKPLIIFGMGSQKTGEKDFVPSMLPEEGIDALKAIGEEATAVSVRGEFTKKMLESVIGKSDNRVFVTGCPSYYTNPNAFGDIKKKLREKGASPTFSVNVTNYSRSEDKELVRQAFQRDDFLIEPSNKNIHQFALESSSGSSGQNLPLEFAFMAGKGFGKPGPKDIASWVNRRYRLFRHLEPWIDFNREYVDATIGTRFHINMASMLSGVPTVWVTHDVRTEELVSALSLPSVSLEVLKSRSIDQIIEEVDFAPFFDSVQRNFENFNEFLKFSGLPQQDLPATF